MIDETSRKTSEVSMVEKWKCHIGFAMKYDDMTMYIIYVSIFISEHLYPGF